MNKLLSTPLAVALSTAFVVSVSLSSCASGPAKEQSVVENKNLNPDEAARKAAEKEKRKEEEKKRANQMRSLPSGGCGH